MPDRSIRALGKLANDDSSLSRRCAARKPSNTLRAEGAAPTGLARVFNFPRPNGLGSIILPLRGLCSVVSGLLVDPLI
jgi:hypothetical protein